MTFSPALEERFAKLLTIYPKGRQRSAVVPMLLYAQDEIGHVSRELIDEVARRCGITPMQVDEVIGYYSMLHRKPLGKFHIQVCTNVCCLLVGGPGFVRARGTAARHRQQTNYARWLVLAGRGGVYGRLFLGSGDSSQL